MKNNKKFGIFGKIFSSGRLNGRGLLFTIMTLFLIFGIFALNEVLNNTAREYSPSSESIQLYSVANSYSNASSLLLDLDKNGYALQSMENVFPIIPVLDRDNNSIEISQDFSLDDNSIGTAFDYLNLAKILLEDKNYSYAYSGVDISATTPKNSAWDTSSTDNSLYFAVLPFCYQYKITDKADSSFESFTAPPSCTALDISKIKQIDITIIPKSSSIDFKNFTCGGAQCTNAYSAAESYNISINNSFCGTNCPLSVINTSIPFSSASETISLSGTNSAPLSIVLNEEKIDFSYNSLEKVTIITKIYFTQNVSGFVVKDVNISTQIPGGTVKINGD